MNQFRHHRVFLVPTQTQTSRQAVMQAAQGQFCADAKAGPISGRMTRL